MPLKDRALPYLPADVQVAPLMVPVSPLPELSETVLPAPSLKEYALTSPAGVEEGWRVREVLWEVPLSDAVMVTDCEVVTVPVAAEKVAEVAPAATVTEAGVVSRALLSEIATAVPPAGEA